VPTPMNFSGSPTAIRRSSSSTRAWPISGESLRRGLCTDAIGFAPTEMHRPARRRSR
jgi:hypothetical protein